MTSDQKPENPNASDPQTVAPTTTTKQKRVKDDFDKVLSSGFWHHLTRPIRFSGSRDAAVLWSECQALEVAVLEEAKRRLQGKEQFPYDMAFGYSKEVPVVVLASQVAKRRAKRYMRMYRYEEEEWYEEEAHEAITAAMNAMGGDIDSGDDDYEVIMKGRKLLGEMAKADEDSQEVVGTVNDKRVGEAGGVLDDVEKTN